MVAALIQRGHAMLSVGDISAARLLFERAAHDGSGAAATALGRTYDPQVLASLGVHGIRPDAATAADWYRSAIALGDAEAASLLRALPASRTP
jgi:TPR repeat protein